MQMPTPIKSELHHWWPRGLSQFWANAKGGTNRLAWNGKVVCSRPANFGAINNGHHIRLGKTPTNWDTSFEGIYGAADSRFPQVIAWLEGLKPTPLPGPAAPFADRLDPHDPEEAVLDGLAECLSSLIVRGPAFRNSIRSTVNHYRGSGPLGEIEDDDVLISMNMKGSHQLFTNAIRRAGKYVVLYSESTELIFGDGFFHNFTYSAAAPLAPKCLIPLTPNIAVLYTRPTQYTTFPRAYLMPIDGEEVQFLNQTVQVYSKDYLFFRNQQPEITPEFSKHEFRQYDFHAHPWIDNLIQTVATHRPVS